MMLAVEYTNQHMKRLWRRVGRRQWFVLQVHTGTEFSVADTLQRKHVAETFVPRVTRKIRMTRRTRSKQSAVVPLFAGYIIIGFSEMPNWISVIVEPHVMGVIGFSGNPAVLPRSSMYDLIDGQVKGFDSEGLQKGGDEAPRLMEGDRCEISTGPFQGKAITVEKINGKYARGVLALFNSQQAVQIPLDQLEVIR